jgi:hypothetical protein
MPYVHVSGNSSMQTQSQTILTKNNVVQIRLENYSASKIQKNKNSSNNEITGSSIYKMQKNGLLLIQASLLI